MRNIHGPVYIHHAEIYEGIVIAKFGITDDPDPDVWATCTFSVEKLKEFYEERFRINVIDYPDHRGEHVQKVWDVNWDSLPVEEKLGFVVDYISEGKEFDTLN